jgi:hypothetical protein
MFATTEVDDNINQRKWYKSSEGACLYRYAGNYHIARARFLVLEKAKK